MTLGCDKLTIKLGHSTRKLQNIVSQVLHSVKGCKTFLTFSYTVVWGLELCSTEF